MALLLRQLGQFAISYFLTDIALKNIQAKITLRKVMMGLAFFIASFLIGFVGIVFILAGIFFALADKDTLINPALISAGITLLLSLLAAIEGVRQFKRLR